jgi:hypothetical protein
MRSRVAKHRSEPLEDTLVKVAVYEVLCNCGADFVVFSRAAERPLATCRYCCGTADQELAGEPFSPELAGCYDPTGPDVQVLLSSAPWPALDNS